MLQIGIFGVRHDQDQLAIIIDTQPIQAQFMVLLSCLVIFARDQKRINSSNFRPISFSSYFNPKILTIAKFVICIGLIPITIYLINLVAFQPYKAAQTIKLAQNESYDWNERAALYEQSMETSPGLATYPYIYLVNSLVKSETTINSSDLQNLKNLVDTWSTNILDKDPDNWRVLFSTARFYQYYFLKTNDTGVIDKAADAVERLKLSAPNVPETANIIRAQELIESGP